MELTKLTKLENQIVKQLEQFGSLNNKEIAGYLSKDPGYISKKMKQLVLLQVVKKKRISEGSKTFNYYSLVDDDIEKAQLARGFESTCEEEEISISSEDIYDADNINLRESTLPRHKRGIQRTSEYYPRQVVQFKDTLRFLEIHDLLAEVLEYLSIESKSRSLTSKESRLVKILSQKSPNYTWILDCITLFLSTAKKIEQVIK